MIAMACKEGRKCSSSAGKMKDEGHGRKEDKKGFSDGR